MWDSLSYDAANPFSKKGTTMTTSRFFSVLSGISIVVVLGTLVGILHHSDIINGARLITSKSKPLSTTVLSKLVGNGTIGDPAQTAADSRTDSLTSGSDANKNSMSACLMIKDDNNRLPEWLAYHYHVLPLRSLVVGVDANSVTSPQEILRTWNESTDMEIQLWHVENLVPPEIVLAETDVVFRQTYFLSACFQYFKKVNGNSSTSPMWVTSHDVDEFITFNRFTPDDPDLQLRNETVLRFNQQTALDGGGGLLWQDELVLARTRVPAQTGGDLSISDFIAAERSMLPWNYQSCVPMTRLQFGARTSSIQDIQTSSGFDANKFDTLRFRQHRSKSSCSKNCKGKVLIDLSRIPENHLVHSHYGGLFQYGPHAPLLECNNTLIPSYLYSVLRVHHYLGSEDAFFAKHDIRRTYKKFNWYKSLASEPETEALHWFQPFIESVGEEKAKKLLNGAGEIDLSLLEKYNATEQKHVNKTTLNTSTSVDQDKTAESSSESNSSLPMKEAGLTEKPATLYVVDDQSYFFDCNDPRSNCTYFQPFPFYESPDGAGYPYRAIAQNQSYGNPDRQLVGNYMRAALKPGKEPPKFNFPHDFTYIHVRKAGGITIRYSFDMFPAVYRIGYNYTVDRVFTVKANQLGPAKMIESIKDMQKSTIFFSFVRDPLERFVSGVSEVDKQGSKRVCFGSDRGLGYLTCCIDKLKTGGFVDEHIIPQSVELYQFAMGNPNTTVALFTIDNISYLQRYMAVPVFSSNTKTGAKKQYSTDLLTDEMVHYLCDYYRMDVVMVRSVGIEVPKCP